MTDSKIPEDAPCDREDFPWESEGSLYAALERMVNHFAILPAEYDEPGSVMAQAREALLRAKQ